MNIRILNYEEIDRKKWDDCLAKNPGSLIYSQSFYLDAMCKWDALVVGDYEAIMPLPYRKKWNILYLYQPAFIQQLGIIGNADVEEILQTVAQKFRFAEITLNHNNTFASKISKLRNNFILDLGSNYKTIKARYSSSLKTNLNWLQKFELQYSTSTDYIKAIELFQSLYANKMPSVSKKDFVNFKAVCSTLQNKNNLVIRTATVRNQLAALTLLLKDKNRLYNVIACTTAFGKNKQANYFLYDKIIQEFSGSGLILDFEGSDKKGIADFYQKFGPVNQPYLFVKWNHLPAIVKLIKK